MAKFGVVTTLAIFSLLFVISVSSTLVSGYGRKVGGKTEISDVKTNKEVQELGRFSVEEFNRKQRRHSSNASAELLFSEVVEAQKQVVSGIKYYLKIEATQNGLRRVFESVVVVRPWARSKELLDFSPSSE